MNAWKRVQVGYYTRTDGPYDAIVKLDGELWRQRVYRDGELIDCGEWDARSVAFRNADRAIRAARRLRSPCGEAAREGERAEEAEGEDDDG